MPQPNTAIIDDADCATCELISMKNSRRNKKNSGRQMAKSGSMSPIPGVCNTNGILQKARPQNTPLIVLTTKRSKCCGTMTKIEVFFLSGCLLFMTAFLLMAILWLVVLQGHRRFTEGFSFSSLLHSTTIFHDASLIDNHDQSIICTNRQCTTISALFLSNMNERINPCDDFYEFACGNYALHHDIRPEKAMRDTIGDIEDRVEKQLKSVLSDSLLLNNDTSAEKEPVWERIARQFYQRCIDEDRISRIESKALNESIKAFGGWPVVDGLTWQFSNISFEQQIGILMNEWGANNILFSLAVAQDEKDSTRNVLQLDQPQLGMDSRWRYISNDSETSMKHYVQLMKTIAISFGADENLAAHDMQLVAEFEQKLAEIHLSPDVMRDSNLSYNPFQISQLADEFPELNLREYIDTCLKQTIIVRDNVTVIVTAVDYYKKLASILHNSPKRVFMNYVVWRMLQAWSVLLPHEQRMPFYEFAAAQNGITNIMAALPKRWEECIGTARTIMDMPVGALYIRHFFNSHIRDQMIDLAVSLKEAFRSKLEHLDWMDEKTRGQALLKADALTYKIGYPDWIANQTRMIRDWGKTVLGENESLVETVKAIRQRTNRNEFQYLYASPDRNLWFESPAQVDAYYAPNWNQMIFPAGIMQFPLLVPDVPKFISFAMAGAVVGHEVSHAFDDQGSHYDHLGTMRDWWDRETKSHFRKKTECFVRQYSQVEVNEVPGLFLNGRMTLGENIADNTGVKTAYSAMKSWQKSKSKADRQLPGLQKYTADQLFFIAYANNWCSVIRPSYFAHLVRTDFHTPAKYRAALPLRNIPEFSEVFQCPKQSYMNPDEKCMIW